VLAEPSFAAAATAAGKTVADVEDPVAVCRAVL
jgi:hypothetical protein